MTEKYNEIELSLTSGIARLTLNRPDIRNAVTGPDMIREIEAACTWINNEQSVKVLVLTAADPAFSAGGNIKDMLNKRGMFSGGPADIMDNYRKQVQRIPRAVYNLEVPSIAAVNGPAVGAGCDLALMCDMRIASQNACFAESFLNVGLIPGDGGAYFLPRLVGQARAAEMTFTGETVSASEAAGIGLVNRTVQHCDLLPAATELAGKIAAKPAAALRMSKRLLRVSQHSTMEEVLELSAAYQALCHSTQEHIDALQSILG
ncbi:MAG: crotonase/enoyl-CoA hydratase family protein [Thermodesulfobacteriota bacterium]